MIENEKKQNSMSALRVKLCLHSNKAHASATARLRSMCCTIRQKQLPSNVITCSTAAERLPIHSLPNGLRLRHASTAAEVQFLYDEQYKQRVYLQHQVTLQPGGTVLDVGANIGCFSMYAAEAVGLDGLVLSVEAAPTAAAALASNMQQHAAWCQARGKQVAKCQVVQAAVSDGKQEEVQLTVFKGAAGWSTLVRNDAEVLNNMQAYLANMLQTASGPVSSSTDTRSSSSIGGHDVSSRGWSVPQQLLVSVAWWLNSVALFKPLSSFMVKAYVKHVMLHDVETISCKVMTVTQIMEHYNLQSIDLLKVDVERAELQVLSGIAPRHWPVIRQVALEVHDINGQLAAVLDLLKRTAGYTSVVAAQEDMMQGTNLYNVYAVRTGTPTMAAGEIRADTSTTGE